jgi:hypothetical protein
MEPSLGTATCCGTVLHVSICTCSGHHSSNRDSNNDLAKADKPKGFPGFLMIGPWKEEQSSAGRLLGTDWQFRICRFLQNSHRTHSIESIKGITERVATFRRKTTADLLLQSRGGGGVISSPPPSDLSVQQVVRGHASHAAGNKKATLTCACY